MYTCKEDEAEKLKEKLLRVEPQATACEAQPQDVWNSEYCLSFVDIFALTFN